MNPKSAAERPVVMTFTVTLTAVVHAEPETGGFSAEVPALPGCYTQGESLEEVRENLREAAEGWLAAADAASHSLGAKEGAA